MAAMPSPPQHDPADTFSLMAWLWNWAWPTLSSAFGAGAMWGATRSTAADHSRRLARLEDSVPAAMKAIGDKIDDNHREVMRLIVGIAQQK